MLTKYHRTYNEHNDQQHYILMKNIIYIHRKIYKIFSINIPEMDMSYGELSVTYSSINMKISTSMWIFYKQYT